ncbi:hypothetical protein Syun_003768 [Stephania yunnanensis]|uniref:Uncharacterized protein n=1 Tax=Stephania yunnanensis TaxID=152371 RepID=A0AAP0Q481_9MAGN
MRKSASPLHGRNEELCWSEGRLPPNASNERKSVTEVGLTSTRSQDHLLAEISHAGLSGRFQITQDCTNENGREASQQVMDMHQGQPPLKSRDVSRRLKKVRTLEKNSKKKVELCKKGKASQAKESYDNYGPHQGVAPHAITGPNMKNYESNLEGNQNMLSDCEYNDESRKDDFDYSAHEEDEVSLARTDGSILDHFHKHGEEETYFDKQGEDKNQHFPLIDTSPTTKLNHAHQPVEDQQVDHNIHDPMDEEEMGGGLPYQLVCLIPPQKALTCCKYHYEVVTQEKALEEGL